MAKKVAESLGLAAMYACVAAIITYAIDFCFGSEMFKRESIIAAVMWTYIFRDMMERVNNE